MRKISRRDFITAGSATLVSLIALDAFWYEHQFIEKTEFYMGDAGPGTKNIKLLQISDLHLRHINQRQLDLAKTINEIRPEIILFTGDIIDRNKNLHLLDKFLGLLDTRIQKTAILGNWECWKVEPLELLAVYKKHNCELIVNHTFQYTFGNTTFAISGMDDLLAGRADFPMAMESYIPSTYHIVMTHCPQHRDKIKLEKNDIPIDLILSGHTHGGQLNIMGFAPFRPDKSGRYISGWYREADPPMYVSRGIGTSGLPIRLGSRSEISVFNFKA